MTRQESTRTTPALAIGAIAAVCALSPARAQEPVSEDTATAREDTAEEEARELRRILHLANGDTLRAKTRKKDGRWEYRADRAWKELPQGFVLRAADEREVEREAAKRKRATDAEDLDARVALARWMAAEGLRKESLLELDQVLDRSAHHAGALELLAERPFLKVPSLDVPEDARMDAMVALYDWAIQMPRATQELAIGEFAKVADREGFSDDVAKALGSHSAARRAFAARLLARLYPGEHLEELLAHTVMDASPEARKSAAEAVAIVGEPGLIAPLVRALETSRYSIVRRNAAESLGYMGYPAAVPALVSHLATAQATGSADIQHGYVFFGRQFAYIQDFDVEVAQFQSIADPQINVLTEGAVQQSGVVAVRQEITTVERGTVRGALERITGENPGRNTKAWLRWWEENEYRWKDKTAVPPETEAPQ